MLKEDTDVEISDYFATNLSQFERSIQSQELKKFTSLDSNSERVNFVMSYPQIYNLSLEVENQTLKNGEKALQLKDVGNKYFGRGEFVKALELYSNAVLLAPQEDLSVILANRSATLYHLERHDYALTDAEEAIRIGYPKELFYKIEERRARCLLGLKRHSEAMLAFRTALQALDDSKLQLEKKQKLESDIRVMLVVMEKGNKMAQKAMKNSQKTAKIIESKKTSPKIKDRNSLYPACSNAVEIKDAGGDIGRHAVATRDIEPGELLAIEKPHCSFLLEEYRNTHCHLCLTKIFVPAVCKTCSYISYCSISCRNADAKTHRNECALLPALWTSKISITCCLALRAITQRPFEELFQLKDKLETSKDKFEASAERPYRGNNFETVYQLVTHKDERSVEDLLHRTYIASWLLRLLKKGPYFPEDVKTADTAGAQLSKGELYIGGLILHNLMLLQFNSHEISELSIPKEKRAVEYGKSTFIGGGLYPTVALFNHSCNPGIIRYYVGTTMIVRAIRTIQAGEEISENYGPIFTVTPEAERKRTLRWQYWFDCKCEACTAHWPRLNEIDPTILRFKCETGKECGNVLPVRTDTEEFMISCHKCRKNTNILKGLKALQDTDALVKVASRNLKEGKHQEALKSFLEILKLLDETLALPIRDYHICQQSIRSCLLALGNVSYV